MFFILCNIDHNRPPQNWILKGVYISMNVVCAQYVSWNDLKWLERTACTPASYQPPFRTNPTGVVVSHYQSTPSIVKYQHQHLMSVEQTDKNTTTDQWGAPRDFTPTVLGIATHCKNITFFGPKVRCLISILSLGWNFSVEGPQLPVASKSSLILKEGWCCCLELELELDWWAWAWSKKLLTEFSDSSICRAITPMT